MDNLFSQTSPDEYPTDQGQEAVDAVASPQSGGNAQVTAPVWKSFVVNKGFQEANREGIRAEQAQIRSADASNRRNAMLTPTYRGANGKLLRKVGRQSEVLNAADWVDHPEAGAEARKSLWDQEIRQSKKAESDASFMLRDPLFKDQALKDKDRKEIEAEGSMLQETDPRHIELKKQLMDDDAYQAKKSELEQTAWNHGAYARNLENTDPETWWQAKKTAEINANRSQITQDAQAQHAQADEANTSLAQDKAALADRMAQGVKGSELPGIQAQQAEHAQADAVIAAQKTQADAKLDEVKQAAQTALQPTAPAQDTGNIFSNTMRGAEVALKQTIPLAQGVIGGVGQALEKATRYGTAIKDWGYHGYQQGMAKTEPLQHENDSLSNVWEKVKKGDLHSIVDLVSYGVGYMGGQMAEMAIVSGMGAVAGGAMGAAVPVVGETGASEVAGAAVGGIGGLVAKGAAKAAAKAWVERSIAKQAMKLAVKSAGKTATEGELAKLAATAGIRHEASRAIGSKIATMGYGLGMEVGTTMPEAFQKAKDEGREQSGADVARAAAFGIGAGALEGVTDIFKLDLVKGKYANKIAEALPKWAPKGAGGRVAAGVLGAGTDAGVEAGTEAVQTVMERLGAKQSITDDEAKRDIIDSAGLGAIGGVAVGGIGGAMHHEGEHKGPDVKKTVNDHLTAIDPTTAPADDAELAKSGLLVHPNKGAEGLAQGVLIERELAPIAEQDQANFQDSQAALVQAQQSGDTKAIKAAQIASDRFKTGQADAVRAAVKVATGYDPHDLTLAELTSLGMTRTGDDVRGMKPKELAAAGIDAPMAQAGADGSVILTDHAIKQVQAVSPQAAKMIAMPEGVARQKAQERKISMESQNDVQRDSAMGSSNGSSPDETNAPVEFDVPMKDGTTLRVQAATHADALQEAAAQGPISGQPPTPVSNVTNAQGQAPVQSQASAPVPVSEVPTGTPGEKNAFATGSESSGNAPAQAQAKDAVKHAYAKAAAKFARVKKKLGERLSDGHRAQTTQDGIKINPKQIIDEALAHGMSESEALQYFDRVLDEEIRHLAQYDAAKILHKLSKSTQDFIPWMQAHYGSIWQSDFAGTEKEDIVRKLYSNDDAAAFDAMSDGDKALEAIRMMSQGKNVTEAAKLWANISESLRTALKAALSALKKLSDSASSTLQSEIVNLENALKQLAANSQPRTGTPKADSAKPTQSAKSDGNRSTAEKAGDSQAPSDGRTESAPIDGTGSSLSVGARVEFVGDDGGLTQGTLGNLNGAASLNGHVRIFPDASPNISVARRVEDVKVLDAPVDMHEKPVGEQQPPSANYKFTSKADAVAWMKANGLNGGHLTKIDTELFNLEVPPGDYTQPKAWYRMEDQFRFTDPSDPDNGFGLQGPFSRQYVSDIDGLTLAEVKKRENTPSAPTTEAKTDTATTKPNGRKEKRKADAQAEGQVLNQDAAGEQSPVAKLSEGKQALKDAFKGMVDGLEASDLSESYTKGIPAERIPQFITAAQKLIGEGVKTAEGLAAALDEISPKLRGYSEAVWSAFRMVDPSLPVGVDWAATYAPKASVEASAPIIESSVAPVEEVKTPATEAQIETPAEAASEVEGEMVNPSNRRPAKEIKAEILQRVEEEIAKLPKLEINDDTATSGVWAAQVVIDGKPRSFQMLKDRDSKYRIEELSQGGKSSVIYSDSSTTPTMRIAKAKGIIDGWLGVKAKIVKFSIPGDGTFRIIGSRSNLEALYSNVKRMPVNEKESKPRTSFITARIIKENTTSDLTSRDSIILGLQDSDYRTQLAKRLGADKLIQLEDIFLRQEGVTREELNGQSQEPAPVAAQEVAPTIDSSGDRTQLPDETLRKMNGLVKDIEKMSKVLEGTHKSSTSRAQATTQAARGGNAARMRDGYKQVLSKIAREALQLGQEVPPKVREVLGSKIDYNEAGNYEPIKKPTPLDHGVLNIPGRTNGINAELDRYKAEQTKSNKEQSKIDIANRKETKAQAQALYAQHGEQILSKYKGLNSEKEVSSALKEMATWNPSQFIKLAEKFIAETAASPAPGTPEFKQLPQEQNQSGLKSSELPNPTSQKGLEYSAKEADRVLDEHAPTLSEKLASQVATFRESVRGITEASNHADQSGESAISSELEWAKSEGKLIDTQNFEYLGNPHSSDTTEHEVWHIESQGKRAIKRTLAGSFGQTPVFWKGKILMKNASLPEYLRRMALQISVFGSDLKFEGVTSSDGSKPSAVISQGWVTAKDLSSPSPSDSQIVRFMKDHGFEKIRDSFQGWARKDGVIVIDTKSDNFINSDHGIVPIDLQMGAIGKSEVSKLEYGEGLRSSDLPAAESPPFYSQLQRTIEAKMPKSATPAQVLQIAASGAKAEEVKWSGIIPWLQGKEKVSKDEVMDWLRNEGSVRFQEVTNKSESVTKWSRDDEYNPYRNYELLDNEDMRSALEEAAQQIRDSFDVKDEITPVDSDGDETYEGHEEYPPVSWKVNLSDGNTEQFNTKEKAEKRLKEELDWIENESVSIGDSSVTDYNGNTIISFSPEQEQQSGSTKFSEHTLPGGENYREVVLAMPDSDSAKITPSKEVIAKYQKEWDAITKQMEDLAYNDFEKKGQLDSKLDLLHGKMVVETKKGMAENYHSSHFPDVPNYVAHMRLNDRTDAEGKPGLFIEELQSDRHQAGRDNGYKGESQGILARDNRGRELGSCETEEQAREAHPEAAYFDPMSAYGIPDAPHRKDWSLALFKRALRDAVAEKKSWIGWTNGETQNDRYDLSKQVGEIRHWKSDEEGYYGVQVMEPNGQTVMHEDEMISSSKLVDLVGKDVAQRIIDGEGNDIGNNAKSLSGDGLKVGGSGMKGFYDQILPKEIGKYMKQWGAKVEQSKIHTDGPKFAIIGDQRGLATTARNMTEAKQAMEDSKIKYPGENFTIERRGTPIWRIDITPQMEKGVKAGQALFASDLPSQSESPTDTFKRRVPVNQALVDEATRQQDAFGKNVASGDLASFGSNETRKKVDAVTAVYEFVKTVKKNADQMNVARQMLSDNPADVERKLLMAATDRTFSEDAADHLAIQLLIDQKIQEAGNDIAKHGEIGPMIMAYRMMRREAGRLLQIGYDRFLTPAERHRAALTNAIYEPTRKIQKVIESKPLAEREAFIRKAAEERLAKVQDLLKQYDFTVADITAKNNRLTLVNSRLDKEIKKTRTLLNQDVLTDIQKGASMQDLMRRWKGVLTPEQAQEVKDKARADLGEKLRGMIASGMTPDQIRESMKDGLRSSDLGGAANAMSPAEVDAMVEKMLSEDFGLPPGKIKETNKLKKIRPPKTKEAPVESVTPMSADWSRPELVKGLLSYDFETKDRAGIMARVEALRMLAGAVGKVDSLKGEQQVKAKAAIEEINKILAKYGSDLTTVLNSDRHVEDYGFDINDINHVASIGRMISTMDADWIDKASEVLYANMLSGLQTMMVNAGAIIPAAWESSVGRGVEMAINQFIKDPMSAQLGEVKYMLRALGPALTRAKYNAMASFQAQHPMADRDLLNHQPDLERIMGGQGYRANGSISGKKGDFIRTPGRILMATDDFNTTLLSMVETAAFAYRLAKIEAKKEGSKYFGMKEGDANFDRFMRVQVNTPGSEASLLGFVKAKRAIYNNPLPGQKDHVTNTVVPTYDIGDQIGHWAGDLTSAMSKEHDSMFIKGVQALLKISFFPFQRVPFNILRKGLRYAPNPISLFDIMVVGGIGNNRTIGPDGKGSWKWNAGGRNPELVERMGQQLQGAVLMMALAAIGAGEGDDDDQDKPVVITGSSPFTPQGRAERDTQSRSGLSPYRISFRRNDGSERFGFNYGRIEPVATTLAAIIDTMKSMKRAWRSGKDTSDAASEALGGLVSQAQDKSFLKGFGDLMALINNATAQPDLKENRKLQQFLAGKVAMVMPNIIKQPIREADSIYRDRSTDFMQELLYQLAPYGQKEAKIDPYGHEVTRPGTSVSRIADVTEAGTAQVHPIDGMLLRFRDKHPADAWFPAPIVNAEYKNPRNNEKMKMTEPQLEEFRIMAGKRADILLKRESINFANPSAYDVEKVKKTITQARSEMKKALSYKFSRQ